MTKNKGGRPTKLTRTVKQKITDYLKWCNELVADITKTKTFPTIFPTKEHFCIKIGIHRDTMYQWVKEDKWFSDVYKHIESIHTYIVSGGAMNGKYNQSITKLFLSKQGYADETEIKHSGSMSITTMFNISDQKRKSDQGE
jgi:hypothetical protein